MARVIALSRDDIRWNFHTGEAQVACPSVKPVDPFPAYPHDPALVKATLAGLPQFELQPTRVWLLPVEILARTNGWAEPGSEWDADEGKYLWTPGEIVMPAKRIPPHPAVTRYTVAHETGHHACHQLEKMRGQQPHAPVDEDGGVLHEYAKIRRLDLEACFQYGGGLWHQHVAELDQAAALADARSQAHDPPFPAQR